MNQDQNTNVSELNSEKETEGPEELHQEPDLPLFLRDTSEGKKGDAQDEKDTTGE